MAVRSRAAAFGAVISLALLFAAPSGLSWHSPDEVQTTRYGATAGDARILDDAAHCLEAVGGADDWTCVALYPHFRNERPLIPLTPQRPAPCASDTFPGPRSLQGRPSLFYASAFEVRYDEAPGVQSCQAGVESSGAGNFTLLAGAPIIAFWYIAANPLSNDSPDTGLHVMPCLTLEMRLEAGSPYWERQTVAVGRTTKTLVFADALSGTPGPNIEVPCPGGASEVHMGEVAEFVVNLDPVAENLAWNDHWGLVVSVRAYHHEPWDDAPLEPLSLRWDQKAGDAYPNRIVLALSHTIAVTKFEVRNAASLRGSGVPVAELVAHNGPFLSLRLDSALGRHDIDVANIRFAVEGPNGTRTPVDLGPPIIEGSHTDGNGRVLPVWYRWDEALASSGSALLVSVPNWQHTSVVETRLALDGPPPVQEPLPSLGAAAMAVVLLGCLFLLRRRPA